MALGALAALMGVWFAAMASPGPDVVQIIRLGARSTRAALWAAIGSTTGLVVWTVASLAGLTALISAHPVILVALQVAGGGYLLWMAFSAISGGIKERRAPATVVGTEKSAPQPRGFTPDGIIKLGTAYRMGLVSDLSNPKVVIFFGAIFANFIDPGMGFGANALVGSVLIVESLIIFVGVALCTRAVSKWMSKNSANVDIFSGVVFALLGVIILAEGIRGVLAL